MLEGTIQCRQPLVEAVPNQAWSHLVPVRSTTLLNWLYTAISWIMLRWHDLFSTFLPANSGLSWALSIMFLVITLRVLMFRFFVKQVKTQRAMQELNPKIQALRQKYKDDRQTLSREILALQQEAGVNMAAGCLPVLLQAPVFFALFHVLRRITPGAVPLYSWTQEKMDSAANAKLFGAPIPAAFNTPGDKLAVLGGNPTATHIVAVVLIVFMVAATFFTQRMVMTRTTTQLDPQQAMIQKLMLYGMPASLAVSGFFFPVGVLLYWFTNNLWTLGQQFYILRRMPMKTPDAGEKKPTIDPKLLAPKPGAKPLHPKSRRPAVGAGSGQATQSTPDDDSAPAPPGPQVPAPPPAAAKAPGRRLGQRSQATKAAGPRAAGPRAAGTQAAAPNAPAPSSPNGATAGAAKNPAAGGADAGAAVDQTAAAKTNGTPPAKRPPAKSATQPKSGKKRRR
ncbi:MAG TPA: membrane protein insertase YidC [Mycobacteriales bacterium]|nr:membrane protein insertase YidC [Mycobacteriales bacterium]